MIEVDRLTKRYGPVPAIQDVSFTVEKGQIVGFLGPNGAGKTTTMRILSCFMPASSGTARVAGYDVFEQSLEVRRRIGYLPENVPLYGDMTVAAYLDFVANIKGIGRGERRRRVGEVLERCQIPDVRERLIGRLSKGYRQRVGLAQALIARSGRADPRRADDRPRSQADRRHPAAHQVAGRRPHGHPLDAHPARGVDGVRGRRSSSTAAGSSPPARSTG